MKPRGPGPTKDWRTERFLEAYNANAFGHLFRYPRMVRLGTGWYGMTHLAYVEQLKAKFRALVVAYVGRDFANEATVERVFSFVSSNYTWAGEFRGQAWDGTRIKWAHR